MATTRPLSRKAAASRTNPLRDLGAGKQRSSELHKELPSLIEARVGEHIQKLESKLLKKFKELGEKAVEASTAVLNDQLAGRIKSLENVAAMHGDSLLSLRDLSRAASQKVSAAVCEIEKSIVEAVPGFTLPLAPYASGRGIHPQFRLEPRTELVRLGPREAAQTRGVPGFCPNCTSPNVRRAARSGFFEEFLRLFFIAPFRCRGCRYKFYRF